MKYIWQRPDWPEFQVDPEPFMARVLRYAEKTGTLGGMIAHLSPEDQVRVSVELLAEEAIKTSRIEGELLDRKDVMSSIRNHLGVTTTPESVHDPLAEGTGALMTRVRNTWDKPLTEDMLHDWHQCVMKGSSDLQVGGWRTHSEPMQVISGPIGSETVHFEAPPSARVPAEMKEFIRRFNHPEKELPAPLRAATVHLYFESIHPYEDGNGRIGRALSEKVLSQSAGRPTLLSLSRAIEEDRSGYYAALKHAQHTGELREWVDWFLDTLLTAQKLTEHAVTFTLAKAQIFHRIEGKINTRQQKALNRMFKEGPDGFKGGMTAKKYCVITGASKATATRDLRDLVDMEALQPEGAGRSVRYHLNLPAAAQPR